MQVPSRGYDALGLGIMCECNMNVRTRQNRMRCGKVTAWRRLTAAHIVRSRNPITMPPPSWTVPLVSSDENGSRT